MADDLTRDDLDVIIKLANQAEALAPKELGGLAVQAMAVAMKIDRILNRPRLI